MTDNDPIRHEIDWRGIRIEISYQPSWSESYERIYSYPLAHLKFKALRRKRRPWLTP